MDGRPNRRNNVALSNFSDVVFTGPGALSVFTSFKPSSGNLV